MLIDSNGQIVAGHGRVAAARQIGMNEVPTIEFGHLSDAERRAYVIADNRLAELAGWDREILAIELQALSEIDLDFDVEITGFETAELDLLLDDSDSVSADPADDIPAPEAGPPVTRPGVAASFTAFLMDALGAMADVSDDGAIRSAFFGRCLPSRSASLGRRKR